MTGRFLGLTFAPVTLADRDALTSLLRRFPQRISGYTFASLVAWARPFAFGWTRLSDDAVLLSRAFGPAGETHLLQPLGRLRPQDRARLLDEAARLPYALRLLSVSSEFLVQEPELAAAFDAVEDRAGANYLYRVGDLVDLPGRRYSKKRNLIAQFETAHGEARVEPLDAACGSACLDALLALARAQGEANEDRNLAMELEALEFTLPRLDVLEQDGVLVRVDGRPAAFSVLERLSPDVAAVHFEKADRTVKGLYQIVNRASARRIAALGCTVVNREEDLGDDGLRQAKLSYHPFEIAEVFDLTLRR